MSATANGKLWGIAAADWAAIQEKQCQPVYVAALQHAGLKAADRYLDVGCGAGLAAQIAAEAGALVSGLDAAENLLAIARSRVPAADFHLGDLEALPFADDSFDLVTGFNSFQYATHPGAALAEARRVAKPGANIVVMTWSTPEGMEAALIVAALKPLLPAPPPNAPGPFALSNESALRAFASAAGLETVEVFDVDSPWHYTDLETALRGLGSTGVAARAIENSSAQAVHDAHAKALEPFRQANGSFRIGATFRCLLASA